MCSIKAFEDAAGKHRALVDTMNNREAAGGLLKEFKQQTEMLRGANQFGGYTMDAGQIQQTLLKLQEIKDKLKAMVPETDWDRVLGDNKSFQQLDANLELISKKANEYAVAVEKSRKEVEQLGRYWQQSAQHMNKANQLRESFGLKAGESFKAYSDNDNSAEKNKLRQLERDKRYWEEVANDAIKRLDKSGAEAAMANARTAANEYDKLKNVIDAVKAAERENLDNAKELLRIQKDKNAEKERQLSTEQQLLKTIEREARAHRIDFASGDTDTRKGIADNMLQRMKERDSQLISTSPNDQWKQLMTAKMESYYDTLQARQDRYWAREKELALKAEADAAAEVDPKEQRAFLGDLQKHQQQMAMQARTPAEAQFWYRKSLETQRLIEESFEKQKAQQEEKLAGIRSEIKSVDDLTKRVEQLSDELRDVPRLDLRDPETLRFLDTVKKELRDIINMQQQAMGGGGGGMAGGGIPGGFGGGGGFGAGRDANPFAGVDFNSPAFGGTGNMTGSGPEGGWNNWGGWGGDPRPNGGATGGEPAGGWGFGAMSSGLQMPASFQQQSMAGSHQSLPQGAFGGGSGQSFTQNASIGNMPIYVNGGSFNTNELAASAR